MGFGTTHPDRSRPGYWPDLLQTAAHAVLDPGECRYQAYDERARICAGGKAVTCAGDSGGPLVDADGRLVGVTSAGTATCGDLPAAFARVAYYDRWLKPWLKGSGCPGVDGKPIR